MGRNDRNTQKRAPSPQTAKAAREGFKTLDRFFRSYEAELDRLLDEVEASIQDACRYSLESANDG